MVLRFVTLELWNRHNWWLIVLEPILLWLCSSYSTNPHTVYTEMESVGHNILNPISGRRSSTMEFIDQLWLHWLFWETTNIIWFIHLTLDSLLLSLFSLLSIIDVYSVWLCWSIGLNLSCLSNKHSFDSWLWVVRLMIY